MLAYPFKVEDSFGVLLTVEPQRLTLKISEAVERITGIDITQMEL